MFTQPPLTLPTVSTKNEARANQNDTSGSKLPLADSLVLLQSLKQSRSIWLTKAFLRFSTRSKDKADQVNPAPPPHSLSPAGSCDLEIGPHLFPHTKIFFVQYRYGPPPAPAAIPTVPPPPTPAPVAQPPPPITVSHELHAKVVAAASKDPDLHHILQLASQGRANVTQLRALGTTIKAIEAGTYLAPGVPSASHASSTPVAGVSRAGQTQSVPVTQHRPVATTTTPVSSTPPTSTPKGIPTPSAPPPKPANALPPTPPPANPAVAPVPTPRAHVPTPNATRMMAPPAIPTTAVLLEFAERPVDRWLLPTEYVLVDRRSNGDIHLSTFYPFDAYVPAGGAVRSRPAHPITIRFLGASDETWNALSRTCTTVASGDVQAILAEVITNVPQRTYLQYRIAPGALWEDIKTANPHAQSFFLPSKTPLPSITTTRQRRDDSTGGGSAPKKRKTDPGDGASSKPKPKGKEKEKEAGPTPLNSTAPIRAPTQPASESISQPQAVVPSNVPPVSAGQIPAPAIPNVIESTSKVATVSTPIPNVLPSKPATSTSAPLIESPSTARPPVGKGAAYSARILRTSQPEKSILIPNNPAGPFYPPQRPALSQASSSLQPQASPPSQQAEQPLNQNTSVDPPVPAGKSL